LKSSNLEDEDNINVDLREVGCNNWMQTELALIYIKWQTSVLTKLNLCILLSES